MLVHKEVGYILSHFNAEEGQSDPSQRRGVNKRAQKVLNMLRPLENSQDTYAHKQIILDLRQTERDPELKQLLNRMDTEDEGHRLLNALQRWVGKNLMPGESDPRSSPIKENSWSVTMSPTVTLQGEREKRRKSKKNRPRSRRFPLPLSPGS